MPIQRHISFREAPVHSGASFYSYDGGTAFYRISLWPYRSLPKKGFVWFIGLTAVLIALPLLAVLGSPVLWGLLPFVAMAVAGIWIALERNYKDGEIREDLTIWSDRIELIRHNPREPDQDWDANPYWVTARLRSTGGPVENYVTLRGNNREVEIGAFLSLEERLELYDELNLALARLPR